MFDKDGNKIGEGTADTNGKATITPTVDLPAGNVTAKATDAQETHQTQVNQKLRQIQHLQLNQKLKAN